MHDAVSDGDPAVSPHQSSGMIAERLRESLTFRRIVDQHIRHAKGFANIKSGQAGADKSPHVVDGQEWLINGSHDDDGWRVRVHDGLDVRSYPVNFGVNPALAIELARLAVGRNAVVVQLHDVVYGDQ